MVSELSIETLMTYEIQEEQEPFDLIRELVTRRDDAYSALRLKNEPLEKLQEGLAGFWKELEPSLVLPRLPKEIK